MILYDSKICPVCADYLSRTISISIARDSANRESAAWNRRLFRLPRACRVASESREKSTPIKFVRQKFRDPRTTDERYTNRRPIVDTHLRVRNPVDVAQRFIHNFANRLGDQVRWILTRA